MRKLSNLYEVYQYMIATNPVGKSQKEIACEICPDLINPRSENPTKQAESWLHKCLNPNQDRHFRPDEFLRFIEACENAEVLINFLCDKFGYERHSRKIVLSAEKELKVLRQILSERKIHIDVEKYIETHKDVISLDIVKEPIWKRIRRYI